MNPHSTSRRAAARALAILSALAAALATPTPSGAQGACASELTARCADTLGGDAGAVSDECRVQHRRYLACLNKVIDDPVTRLGRPGPQEIGAVLSEVAKIYQENDRVGVSQIIKRLGDSVTWEEKTVDDAYLSQSPIVGSLDLTFLDKLDTDDMGVRKKVWLIELYTGDVNAAREDLLAVRLSRFPSQAVLETARDSFQKFAVLLQNASAWAIRKARGFE